MSAKNPKPIYICTECASEHPKWQGQCSGCKQWNTLDLSQPRPKAASGSHSLAAATPQPLNEIDLENAPRLPTHIQELDRVLGGGLVRGSALLLGGQPGAGKSTLLLQTVCELARDNEVLYVTGEESMQQVAMRAARLDLATSGVNMLSETSVENILRICQSTRPTILIIDSIQVMHTEQAESAPGSVSQVRESAAALTQFAKHTNTVLFMVGHVTKEGSLAGPKVLEHMIDASLLLEDTDDSRYRTLRGIKNRFGAVNELGIFAMLESGLREVKNPSAIFLNRSAEQASGSVVMVIWEGTRPLMVEIQALVDDAQGGNPRRVAVGLDHNRLSMLLAILNRHAGIYCADKDVFVNVVGGVKVSETAADLALLAAILSSFWDTPLPRDLVIFGEAGLSGEIRPVPSGLERTREAQKHGFTRGLIPAGNAASQSKTDMDAQGVKTLSDAVDKLQQLIDG